MLNSGERLGDWIIEGALGQGATGSVYRCHHVVTGLLRAANTNQNQSSKAGIELKLSLTQPAIWS